MNEILSSNNTELDTEAMTPNLKIHEKGFPREKFNKSLSLENELWNQNYKFLLSPGITGSPQAGKTKTGESVSDHDLHVFCGEKVKGALRELWK